MNLLYDVLPGELHELEDEPNPLPLLGGCGQALITAAEFLIGRDTAGEHFEVCSPCREVLINLGRRASALEWRCGTDPDTGTDTETPQTATPASTAV